MGITLAGTRLSTVAIACAFGLNAASAGEPVAIVENICAGPEGLAFMDYLEEGRVIDLGPGGTITLGYLSSCWLETIHGGRVVVGREKSVVESGKVQRKRVDCDGGAIRLSVEEADKSGVIVFRRPPGPQRTLYGTSPAIRFVGAGGAVSIERLDKPGQRHTLTIHGHFVDLGESGIELARGGIYRATAGNAVVVFKIDQLAGAGRTPIVGRLLRF